MASQGLMIIADSIGFGMLGAYPDGDFTGGIASSGIMYFTGANGDPVPEPLVANAGTFEISNNTLVATGIRPQPPEAIGWLATADTGQSDGTIESTYLTKGSFGDESGIVLRYADNGNFIDCVNLNGTITIVLIENDAIQGVLGTYVIPNYVNTRPYQIKVILSGSSIQLYVHEVLAIDIVESTHVNNTGFGFKYGGNTFAFDNLILPDITTDAVVESHYYVSGHSLYTYGGGSPAPADDYTSVGTWWGLFTQQNGQITSGCGDFGQMATHNANWASRPGPPTTPNYKYSSNTYDPWPSFVGQIMSEQDFKFHIFMAANFDQWQPYTVIALPDSIVLLDNIQPELNDPIHYMYIHWPDPVLTPGGVAVQELLTPTEQTAYHEYTRGAYLTWHTDWFADLTAARPAYQIKGVPVGPVISDLIEMEPYMPDLGANNSARWPEFYADGSPHGSQSLYFLCAMVMYRAVHRQDPDLENFIFPVGATQVVQEIRDNLPEIVTFIRNRLDYYNTNGVEVY